jgi:hypothetical protein
MVGSEAIPLIEVTVEGQVVHRTGLVHQRKEHILQISSNNYLGVPFTAVARGLKEPEGFPSPS